MARKFNHELRNVENFFAWLLLSRDLTLLRLCFKRIQAIEPGEISDRLLKSGETMKNETEHFVQSVKGVILSPQDVEKKEECGRWFKIIIDTLNQIIADARLTARSPFDLSMVWKIGRKSVEHSVLFLEETT